MKKDEIYVEFTSHQRKHDCPGYDCVICSQAFEAAMAVINAGEKNSSIDISPIKEAFKNGVIFGKESVKKEFTGDGKRDESLLLPVLQSENPNADTPRFLGLDEKAVRECFKEALERAKENPKVYTILNNTISIICAKFAVRCPSVDELVSVLKESRENTHKSGKDVYYMDELSNQATAIHNLLKGQK